MLFMLPIIRMDTIKLRLLLAIVVVLALVGQSLQTTMSEEEVQSCVKRFSQDLEGEMPEVAKKIESALREMDPTLKDMPLPQLIESKKPSRICEGLEMGED